LEAAKPPEIKRLVAEFETSGLGRSAFCQKHNLVLGTLQRGLRSRRMEVAGQSEGKRLVEAKMAGIQCSKRSCIFLLIEISPELLPGLPALEVL
jgi:hypothetical protein